MKTMTPFRPNHCFGIERWLGRPLSRLERTVIDPLERERHAGRPVRFIIADGRTDSVAVRSAILTYVAWYSHIVPDQNIILSAPLRRIARRYCRSVRQLISSRDKPRQSKHSNKPEPLSGVGLNPVSAREPEGSRSAYGATALCLMGCDLYPRQTRSFERILAAAVPHVEGRPRPLVIIHGTYHHTQGCCPFRWYTRMALAGRICYNVIHTADAPASTAEPYYKVRSARIAAIDRDDPEPYFAESDRATRSDKKETLTLEWLLAHRDQAGEQFANVIAEPYLPDPGDLTDAGIFPDDDRRYLIDYADTIKMLRQEEFDRITNPSRWCLRKIRRFISAGEWVPLDSLARTGWEPKHKNSVEAWHEILRGLNDNHQLEERRADEIQWRTGRRPVTWQDLHRQLQQYLKEYYMPRKRHSRRYPRVPLPAGLDRVTRAETFLPYERQSIPPKKPRPSKNNHATPTAKASDSSYRSDSSDTSDQLVGSLFFSNKIYTGLYPDDLPIVPAHDKPLPTNSEPRSASQKNDSHATSPLPSKVETKMPS